MRKRMKFVKSMAKHMRAKNNAPQAAWILACSLGVKQDKSKILGHKILGLCPGAEYGEAKRWPAEYYAEVANHALKNGWQVK